MYKVMIVDDEQTIVNGLIRLLPWGAYGCEVVAAANDGASALEMIRRDAPNILFTDIRMPKMDGLALIAALRSEFPEIQIAILTGHAEFDYARRSIELGVSHYLLKPSKMNELEDALRQMTDALKASGPDAVETAVQVTEEDIGEGEPFLATEQAEATSTPEEDSAGNFVIQNAIQYIEEHYAEKLSLPDVADKVFVSQWHLSKLISKYTGKSFSEILNGVRINEAKKLLADPSLKIWEISEQVGFSDVTHFSRIFKKMENQSANEYRNHQKQS